MPRRKTGMHAGRPTGMPVQLRLATLYCDDGQVRTSLKRVLTHVVDRTLKSTVQRSAAVPTPGTPPTTVMAKPSTVTNACGDPCGRRWVRSAGTATDGCASLESACSQGTPPHNSDGQSRPRSPLRDGAAWTSVGTQAARNNVPCRLYLETAGELYHPAIGMIGTYTWVLCDDAMETVASAKPSRLWHGEHPVPLPSRPY